MRCIGLFCPWSRLIRIQSYWTMSFWTWSRTDPASIQHPFINGNNPIEACPRKGDPASGAGWRKRRNVMGLIELYCPASSGHSTEWSQPYTIRNRFLHTPQKRSCVKKNLTLLLKGGKWGQPPKMTVKAPCYPFTSSSTRTGFGSDLRMSSSSMMFVAPAYLSMTNST